MKIKLSRSILLAVTHAIAFIAGGAAATGIIYLVDRACLELVMTLLSVG
jgi:hypothetical protein